ncbi:MAG: hypothetical protein AVDCRST_MAG19-3142, partial [uncultured Thermomicrobiales bacterium]
GCAGTTDRGTGRRLRPRRARLGLDPRPDLLDGRHVRQERLPAVHLAANVPAHPAVAGELQRGVRQPAAADLCPQQRHRRRRLDAAVGEHRRPGRVRLQPLPVPRSADAALPDPGDPDAARPDHRHAALFHLSADRPRRQPARSRDRLHGVQPALQHLAARGVLRRCPAGAGGRGDRRRRLAAAALPVDHGPAGGPGAGSFGDPLPAPGVERVQLRPDPDVHAEVADPADRNRGVDLGPGDVLRGDGGGRYPRHPARLRLRAVRPAVSGAGADGGRRQGV